jgi:hypothetical protein
MDKINKNELISEIKKLIDTNADKQTQINPKYIEYFELDELIEIRDLLLEKKENAHQNSNNYLDEIFNKCS